MKFTNEQAASWIKAEKQGISFASWLATIQEPSLEDKAREMEAMASAAPSTGNAEQVNAKPAKSNAKSNKTNNAKPMPSKGSPVDKVKDGELCEIFAFDAYKKTGEKFAAHGVVYKDGQELMARECRTALVPGFYEFGLESKISKRGTAYNAPTINGQLLYCPNKAAAPADYGIENVAAAASNGKAAPAPLYTR